MEKDFAINKCKWKEENGFNEADETFIYFPTDSFNVKETLKIEGFKFSKLLLWHCAKIPIGYEDKVIKVNFKEIGEYSAWGAGWFSPNAAATISAKLKEKRIIVPSHWIGEIGERIKDLPVTLANVRHIETKFGFTQIVTFYTKENDIIKWFTQVEIPFEINDNLILTGTVKDHIEDKYENDNNVTLFTRCKMKAIG